MGDDERKLEISGDSYSTGTITILSSNTEPQSLSNGNREKINNSTIIIVFIIFIMILTITFVLVFPVGKSSTEHSSCLNDWIGYQRKCFYFSENTASWAASQNFCVSHSAMLAVFNSTEELVFLKRYSDHSQYWIGLSRKPGHDWKWINGATFTSWFNIIGDGECAYIHKNGISSASTHLLRKWICSKPDKYIPRS